MNYWPAEMCNLPELHEPLHKLIASLVEPGRKTAKAYYNSRGWVAHVITNYIACRCGSWQVTETVVS